MASYQRPLAVGTYEIFRRRAHASFPAGDPPAPLGRLWEGLETFVAYGDGLEPATLAAGHRMPRPRARRQGIIDDEPLETSGALDPISIIDRLPE